MWKWSFGAVLLLLAAAACDGERAGGGNSETHFLELCTDSCSDGLECLCGVCTRPCDDDSACSSLSAAAECSAACSEATAGGACDVSCSYDDECIAIGKTLRCSNGRCRQPTGAGSGGSGGSGGDGGSPGGGRAGEGGSAGSSASGEGSGASSGAGGASSTESCSGAPTATPVLALPTELDPDVVALVGLVVGSCLPDDGVDRNAAHVWDSDRSSPVHYVRTALQAECLVNARCGCEGIRHCLGTYLSAVEACTTQCSGDVYIGCAPEIDLEEGYSYTVDCGRFGLTCNAAAGCVDGATTACPDTHVDTCNAAGQVETCDNGVLHHGPTCSDFGLACVDGACTGTGDECSEGFQQPEHIVFEATGCDGDLLRACVSGRTATVDCTTRGPGFHCQTVEDISFCGLAAECVPAGHYGRSPTHPPSCSGSVLTFCNAGRLEQVDCLEHGFTGCSIGSGNYGCTPGVKVYE